MQEHRGTNYCQIFLGTIFNIYYLAFSSLIILGVRNELETKAGWDVCDNVVVVFG